MKNLLILLFLLPLASSAQKTHTVIAKETLYSIGRLYEVNPKELASYNKISLENGVKIGQVIKIPEKNITKSEDKTTAADNNNITKLAEAKSLSNTNPIATYHIVLKGESLYQISRKYEGATVANLKKWNKLEEVGLKEGQKLIVGYKSTLETEKPVTVAVEQSKADITDNNKTKIIPPAVTIPSNPPTPPVTPEPPVVKENVEIGDGGYFKSLYIVQSRAAGTPKSENGQAATFKSNSGWDDGKYYCLFNAQAGTIVKVTHTTTQKFIYAKVLDVIPDVQQNEGVIIRLSNSAASELGASAEKFQVSLHYQQ